MHSAYRVQSKHSRLTFSLRIFKFQPVDAQHRVHLSVRTIIYIIDFYARLHVV